MATSYFLPPWCPQQFTDGSGDPVANGTVYLYAPGTTTGQQTYSDTAGTLNANPGVPLNSQGRPTSGAIYLDVSLGYKLVVKDSLGVTVSTYDPLYTPSTLATVDISLCQGRLTLTTGTPVTTADVSAAVTAYWTPYNGNLIALYDGSGTWNLRTFSEITISLVGFTASRPYDVFAYDNGGVVTIETLVWTSATARATALATQNGVLVKSGATTRRYLGTIYINSSGGQTDDSMAKRNVWNYYNRKPRPMRVIETTDSWTYTTSTFRQARATTTNQLECMIGYPEDLIDVTLIANASNTLAATSMVVAIGEDSITTPVAGSIFGLKDSEAASAVIFLVASYRGMPPIGRHVYVWLEQSEAAGTTTWIGDNGGTIMQSGINGVVMG